VGGALELPRPNPQRSTGADNLRWRDGSITVTHNKETGLHSFLRPYPAWPNPAVPHLASPQTCLTRPGQSSLNPAAPCPAMKSPRHTSSLCEGIKCGENFLRFSPLFQTQPGRALPCRTGPHPAPPTP
jgi:hypothetical protein